MNRAVREARRRRGRDDAGFTLLELLVAIAITGIALAGGFMALSHYGAARAERGTADQLATQLRDVAERAQSEGRTYCVSFDSTTTWTVWRYSCDPAWVSGSLHATKMGTTTAQSPAYLGSVSFTTPSLSGLASGCPAGGTSCVYFFPRGVASSGSLVVRRTSSTTTYPIHVEGLTSRVYQG